EGLQGSLKGDSKELDDLMNSVAFLRRAVTTTLTNWKGSSTQLKTQLESFVFQCPRFSLRWLGKPPSGAATAKESLRWDQRRQMLLKTLHHTLDSSLMVIKLLIDQNEVDWNAVEPILQDILTLLQHMDNMIGVNAEPKSSFYVKVSHLYYLWFISLSSKSEP